MGLLVAPATETQILDEITAAAEGDGRTTAGTMSAVSPASRAENRAW